MADLLLSIMMLGGFALLLGAAALWRRGERKKPALMLVAAFVAFANVAIWLIPAP
ncbi:MAG: hypothetical protein RLZZ58_612 [Pseudomonadota bacterium]|jgi:hypothetical protein